MENLNEVQLKKFLMENSGYLKWGAAKIARKFGNGNITANRVNEIRKEIRNTGGNETKTETTQNHYDSKSYVPDSQREAYKAHLDDLGITEDMVDSVKFWQTFHGEPRFSVVVDSAYSDDVDEISITDVISDHMSQYTFPEIEAPETKNNKERICGHIDLFDAHIDKLSLCEETYQGYDLTLEDNVESFKSKYKELVHNMALLRVSTLYFPIGNDFWETNDHWGQTSHGTDVEVNIPWHISYRVGLRMIRWCIDYAAQLFEEVYVPIIYGNHSEDKEFTMGVALEEIYSDIDHVDIDNEKKYRKYYQFGNNLFGFSHGYRTNTKSKIEKLPLNMAHEAKQMWAATDFHSMWLGHIHKKEKYKILSSLDTIGCEINFLRTVGGDSAYELQNGYTGIPKTASFQAFSESGRNRWNDEIVWW